MKNFWFNSYESYMNKNEILLGGEGSKGKPPKKKGKNFTTSVNYGGVSKFWCVNLKKVLFLELIFQQKNML